MLMIRLARTGKTKQAYFKLIVSEKTKDTHGDYLEALGSIDPHANPRAAQLKTDRIRYWLDHGAQVSPSVHNLLVDEGIVEADKVKVWTPKKKAAPEGAAAPATPAPAAKAEAVAPEPEKAAESVADTPPSAT